MTSNATNICSLVLQLVTSISSGINSIFTLIMTMPFTIIFCTGQIVWYNPVSHINEHLCNTNRDTPLSIYRYKNKIYNSGSFVFC